jgi:hypothetical protein
MLFLQNGHTHPVQRLHFCSSNCKQVDQQAKVIFGVLSSLLFVDGLVVEEIVVLEGAQVGHIRGEKGLGLKTP